MKPYYDHAGITILHGDARDRHTQEITIAGELVRYDPGVVMGFEFLDCLESLHSDPQGIDSPETTVSTSVVPR